MPTDSIPAESSAAVVRREVGRTVALAVPMIAGQVGQMLMGLADTLMVGRVGVTPLAAAAFCNSIMNVLLVFGIGLTAGVGVLVAQAHGAGKSHDAGEVTRHGMFIGLAAATIMTIGCAAAVSGDLLGHAGQAPEVIAQSRPFLLLLSLSMIPAMVWQVLKQFCEALSRPWAPMSIMGGAVGFNVLLNWIFIYGHLGMPALGLTGAGVGTLVARIGMMIALAVFAWRVGALRAALPAGWRAWLAPFEKERLRGLLAFGFPVALQLVLEVGAFATAALMMGWWSPQALAAHQIAITCAATTFMFPLGLGLAVCVRIGQAVGAQSDRRTVRVIGFSGIGLAAVMMAGSALTFLLLRHQIAGLFVHDDGVLALAAELLAVAGVFQIADGIQVVGMSALRGLSDVKVPVLIALASYWLVALPTSYIVGFTFHFGPRGIWMGLASGLGFAAVSLSLRFHRKT